MRHDKAIEVSFISIYPLLLKNSHLNYYTYRIYGIYIKHLWYPNFSPWIVLILSWIVFVVHWKSIPMSLRVRFPEYLFVLTAWIMLELILCPQQLSPWRHDFSSVIFFSLSFIWEYHNKNNLHIDISLTITLLWDGMNIIIFFYTYHKRNTGKPWPGWRHLSRSFPYISHWIICLNCIMVP